MLTVKELAEYLNLNEKIVYKLVREKKIPGTRITGKWTFSKYLIRNWIEAKSADGFFEWKNIPVSSPASDLFIAGSDDLILERIISIILKQQAPEILAYFAPTGSMGGIKALQMGKAHLAGIHLYDPESGLYNIPYLDNNLAKKHCLLYNLAYRTQGFIMKKGLTIQSVQDIATKKLRYINRESGSGTRLLFDLLCEEQGLTGKEITGYNYDVYTHMEVGIAILKGEADIGLGIQSVADSLKLDFHPLRKERYDVVVPAKNLALRPVQIFFNVLHSSKFRQLAKGLVGYDLSQSGELLS